MGKRVFMFPGQGSQYIGMGKEFYDTMPNAKAVIDLASEQTGLDIPAAKADFKASLGKVLTTSTNLDALNELKMGSVDAVLMDEIVAQYNITKQGGNYKVLEEALAEEEYAVGFLKGNTHGVPGRGVPGFCGGENPYGEWLCAGGISDPAQGAY